MNVIPHLQVTKTDQGYIAKQGTHKIAFPPSDQLREAAIAEALTYYGEDCEASRILADCDFEFEVAPGKDFFSDQIGLVIITSAEHAAVLEGDGEDMVAVMSTLLEVCPNLDTSRVVVRGELLRLGEKKFEIPDPVLADDSPDTDNFVRTLIASFVSQGRTATAFCEAARYGHLGLIQQMLREGIDVDARSEHGSTALIGASSAGQLPIVRALLAAGANVNVVGNQFTPLIANLAMLHSEQTYLAICSELLQAGADPTICDTNGRTALNWAESRNSEMLMNLLNSWRRD